MNVPILRPLSVGEVLDVSFGLYRAKFAQLLLITLLCRAIPIVLGVYLQASGGPFAHPGLTVLSIFVNIVLSAVAIGGSTFVIADAYLGRETTGGEALHRSLALIGRLTVVSVLVALAVLMGLVLFIVPGCIFLSGLALSNVVAVLEPDVRTLATLDRSWALSKGFRGKVFAALLVGFLLLFIPTMVAGVAVAVMGLMFSTSAILVTAVFGSLIQVLVTPYFYVLLTVLYYDLRVRKEGLDLELLATSLQPV